MDHQWERPMIAKRWKGRGYRHGVPPKYASTHPDAVDLTHLSDLDNDVESVMVNVERTLFPRSEPPEEELVLDEDNWEHEEAIRNSDMFIPLPLEPNCVSVSEGDFGGWIQPRMRKKKTKVNQGKAKVERVTNVGGLVVCFK